MVGEQRGFVRNLTESPRSSLNDHVWTLPDSAMAPRAGALQQGPERTSTDFASTEWAASSAAHRDGEFSDGVG